MGRKIDVIVNDGSPLKVTERSIFGEDGRMGIGGAELALLTMCAGWQFYGNQVTLYNNPHEGGASSFSQKTLDEFIPSEDRDVLIIFRSPNVRIADAKGKKVWWSCDQFTVGDFRDFSNKVEKIVTISPFHTNYFKEIYGITKAQHIDLPVRTWEYKPEVPKIKHRCIFTSIPDRGLMPMNAAWPLILREVPDASLVITSDWRLWTTEFDITPYVQPYKLAFSSQPNVSYRGAVNRKELIQIQMEADLLTYPCTYQELFCITCAEAQIAGAFPITSDCGALASTNMGLKIHGNPMDANWIKEFVKHTVELLTDPKLRDKQDYIKSVSRTRFSIENIIRQWDEVFE